MGGETGNGYRRFRNTGGLSPRGRGNPAPRSRSRPTPWSIPAWAGKPDSDHRRITRSRVYPRVGGETSSTTGTSAWSGGLSPRGRGNPAEWLGRLFMSGSIPAWAGKPIRGAAVMATRRVYPRVGGETPVSPLRRARLAGLSPRGRGNLYNNVFKHVGNGSIPAWAGKPSLTASPRCP